MKLSEKILIILCSVIIVLQLFTVLKRSEIDYTGIAMKFYQERIELQNENTKLNNKITDYEKDIIEVRGIVHDMHNGELDSTFAKLFPSRK